MSPRPIGVAVVGLGFMGRTHLAAYAAARAAGVANRVVAVCDPDAERLTGRAAAGGNVGRDAPDEPLFDPAQVRTFTDPGELFADDEVELVSLCTPTDTHVELAERALEAGVHVLVEKPVAVDLASVERLERAARDSAALCMPALCMRFWPGWSWLRERVSAGTFGAPRSASFRRLAAAPGWSREFYGDARRSGGALADLHVHDADFVRWCFGEPESVSAVGTLDHVTALYRFAGGPAHAAAEGGWDLTPGFPFRMRYTVVFDDATADFDLAREPALVLARRGRLEPVPLEAATGWELEVRHFLECVEDGREPAATLADAVGHTRLLDAERASLASGGASIALGARSVTT